MIYKTKAREDAFLVLYQWDIRGGSIEELIEEYLSINRVKNSEQRRYMRKLIRTYFEHAEDNFDAPKSKKTMRSITNSSVKLGM
jgi:N utilization substance protein B